MFYHLMKPFSWCVFKDLVERFWTLEWLVIVTIVTTP